MIGGVATDDQARTTIPGLYACGEASCTGYTVRIVSPATHYSKASSSAKSRGGHAWNGCGLEPMRTTNAHRIAIPLSARPYKIISDIRPSDRSELDLADVRRSLRSVMWRHVGIEREGDRLAEVQEMFEFWARYTLDKIFDERHGWGSPKPADDRCAD